MNDAAARYTIGPEYDDHDDTAELGARCCSGGVYYDDFDGKWYPCREPSCRLRGGA